VNLLGVDTSTAATAVCVARSDGTAFEHVPEPSALTGAPGHARELMPAVWAKLDEAGIGFSDLDAVAVGVGPGAFTGLRIGIATARAIAGSHGLELRKVSSLAALAEGIGSDARLPLIDARRGELFCRLDVAGRTIWPDFLASPQALLERLRTRPPDDGGRPLAAGDGSLRFRQILEDGGVDVAPDGSDAHVVRALHVCRLAAEAAASPPETVLPVYLRDPDAKPSR
jgi:tRNA threonylcarbamoyladenosine biosynthesis protein TsaB